MLKKFKKINEQNFEYIFYVILFCIFFIWSLMLRFDHAPDELGRYSICQYIFNHGRLPHGGDMEIRMEAWGFSYAFQPILPYIIGGVFMKITSFFTQNAYFYLISARFVSVLCGVIMAVFVRKIAKRVFTDTSWQWIFTLMVMLLPQTMFMFVYVNTDSMALLSCAIIVYAWICGFDTSWNLKSCIMLSIGIILCAMSYYNAYGFILSSIIIFVIYHISYNGNSKSLQIDWSNFFKKGLLIALLVLIGTGWWFVRSYVLYDGDFLGLRIRDEYAENFATKEILKPSHAKTYYNAGLSIFQMLRETAYINDLAVSFIGQFGNMSVVLHNWIYTGYALILGCGAFGLFIKKSHAVTKIDYNTKNILSFHLNMILCILIPIYLCTYSSYRTDYQPQGRYILPIVIPLMYFITIGLKKLFDLLIRNNFIYNTFITALIIWFFIVVYFFMKDMVFALYWSVFVNFIKSL